MPRKRFLRCVVFADLIHRNIRHLHFPRSGDVAHRACLQSRHAVQIAGLGLGVGELQLPPRHVAPAITGEFELHRFHATGKPDPTRHAPAHAVVDFSANDCFIDAPSHARKLGGGYFRGEPVFGFSATPSPRNVTAMTRYESYISKDWRESGTAYVVAARLRDNGTVEIATLLVDCWCLGVKDAFFIDDYSEGEFRDTLRERLPEDNRQSIHPAFAKKLLEGAVTYAQQFGFAPHRDYKNARRVFNGVDAATSPEDFVYGKDGKPLFIASEDDSAERISRVLTMLEAHCGKDGFHYICPAEEEDDLFDDDEELSDDVEEALELRDDLMDWLDEEPENVPHFFEFSGLITGMLLCPGMPAPLKIMDVLWGPQGRTWADAEEAKFFSRLLMSYWNLVNSLILETVAPDSHPEETCIDVWETDFAEKDKANLALALSDWCAGLVRATQQWPEYWGNALTRPDLIPHWELIRLCAAIDQPGHADRIEGMGKETPARRLGSSVAVIARALRQPLPQT